MRILCTFPGRAGDLIWALPTVRMISETEGAPVDLLIAGEFASMIPLLEQQPYLGQVTADPRWNMSVGYEPPQPARGDSYDQIYDLGYRRWPELPLPFEVLQNLQDYNSDWTTKPEALELGRPWITVEGPGAPCDVATGFTEAWFELKYGLLCSIEQFSRQTLLQLTPWGSRWTSEVLPATVSVLACDWLDAARAIRNSDLFFGDCSALHVLAVALGKPVVLCEPMEARHNDIFYPLGKTGPQVTLVTGNDGLPTFDARHCADALERALRGVSP